MTKKPPSLQILQPVVSSTEAPLVSSLVQAGFPSPAEDSIEGNLNLNEYLIHHPSATFFVRVAGNSMVNIGIFEGDILIVDRSLEPRHNHIVIAVVDGELTLKRLYKKNGTLRLLAENPAFPPLTFTDDTSLSIWGVVTATIHQFVKLR